MLLTRLIEGLEEKQESYEKLAETKKEKLEKDKKRNLQKIFIMSTLWIKSTVQEAKK